MLKGQEETLVHKVNKDHRDLKVILAQQAPEELMEMLALLDLEEM